MITTKVATLKQGEIEFCWKLQKVAGILDAGLPYLYFLDKCVLLITNQVSYQLTHYIRIQWFINKNIYFSMMVPYDNIYTPWNSVLGITGSFSLSPSVYWY